MVPLSGVTCCKASRRLQTTRASYGTQELKTCLPSMPTGICATQNFPLGPIHEDYRFEGRSSLDGNRSRVISWTSFLRLWTARRVFWDLFRVMPAKSPQGTSEVAGLRELYRNFLPLMMQTYAFADSSGLTPEKRFPRGSPRPRTAHRGRVVNLPGLPIQQFTSFVQITLGTSIFTRVTLTTRRSSMHWLTSHHPPPPPPGSYLLSQLFLLRGQRFVIGWDEAFSFHDGGFEMACQRLS
jgi:hypothetical protein